MNSTSMEPPWQLETTNTSERLEFLQRHGSFHDVVFHVEESGKENKTYPTHMLILSSVSPVFEANFYPETPVHARDNLPVEVTVTRFTQRSFETMLAYAYSPQGNVRFEGPIHALETYHVARAYMIDHLKKLCIRFLRSAPLAPEDIIPIYEDELHTEIVGLDERCMSVLEKKPLLVMRIAAEIARCETVEVFLQRERLAIPFELALLKRIVEGARIRHFDEQSEIGNLTIFLRVIIFPFIRFLTMTSAQFALAVEVCQPAISKQEGFEIFYKLCHPYLSPNYDDFPPWCNTSVQPRIAEGEIFEIIPKDTIFRNRPLESQSLTSKLEIKVREGGVIISGIWVKYRRSIPMPRVRSEGNVPSSRCTLHIRNPGQMIAYDVIKDLVMDEHSSEKHLPFVLPLTVLRSETGEVTLTLSELRGLEFYECDSTNLSVAHEHFTFNISVLNQRTRERDKLFSISKIDYSLLYT